jgi:hypothetical protein
MADTNLPALFGTGDHASRPAAGDVGSGALYSCTDHDLVYQTDGSSWTTWADLTGGAANLAGSELDYVAFTGAVNISATTEGTANTIVTGSSVAYDGSTIVKLEFFAPETFLDAASRQLTIVLYDGSSAIGVLGRVFGGTGHANARIPITVSRRFTPSNASHTYSIRGFTNAGTQQVNGGASGTGALVAGHIQITRISP